MNINETTSHPEGPTMYSEVVSFHCAECDLLRAGLVDADTLRRAEIESRNREIASLRAELAAAKADLAKAHAAHAITAMDRLELCKANERLRALCVKTSRYSCIPDDVRLTLIVAGRGDSLVERPAE